MIGISKRPAIMARERNFRKWAIDKKVSVVPIIGPILLKNS